MNPQRLPFVTLAATLFALAAQFVPGAAEALQYDRAGIASGELWRLVTGHLTHWNTDHLLWDAAVFAALGAWVETTTPRRRYAGLLVASCLAISAGVGFRHPEMATYRGLSGIDTALFMIVTLRFLGEKIRQRETLGAALAGMLLAGFVVKTVYETALGATLFVDSSAAGFTPAPLAHLLGAAVGAAFAWRGIFSPANRCRSSALQSLDARRHAR